MTERKMLIIIFFAALPILFLSILNFILTYMVVFLITMFLSGVMAIVSFFRVISIKKEKIDVEKQKNQNVREFYRYNQIFDPSDMDN